MKIQTIIIVALVTILFACKKNKSTGGPPANLVVTATVNPDQSGNVSFVAKADNAVSYDFDFGNNSFLSVANGIVTIKYAATGNYNVTVVAKSSGGQSTTKTIQVNVTIRLNLVWSDEFNTDGAPDASKWGYDIGTGSNGWGNNELQYYTNRPENVTVSNGTLKIILKKENFSGSGYTSTRLLSKDKYSIKYGKVEVRAKFPVGAGTWPAIWMLGNNINTVPWPACGEIDIVEHVGNQLNKIYGTLHYPGRSGGNANGATINIPTATTDFNKYTLEWSASEIKISANDVVFFTFSNNNTVPFNQNFFFILNVAMGGNFGGTVDPAFTSSTMEIDYIRVYQ